MAQKNNSAGFMIKLSTFIVDKRNLIFLLFVIAIVFSAVSSGWVKVENNLTAYLPNGTETTAGLALMDDEFTTFGSAKIVITNISYARAEQVGDQIAAFDGVSTVSFDNTAAHYSNVTALYDVTFQYDEDDERALNALDALQEGLGDYDVHVQTSMGDTTSELVAQEMNVVIVLVAVVVLSVLLLTSQTYAEIPVLLLTFISSAILNTGTNFLLGTISFVSNSVTIVLQLALSIDYAIILCNRFKEEHETLPIRQAAIAALSKAIPEITASSLTTVGGLAALLFMQFKITPSTPYDNTTGVLVVSGGYAYGSITVANSANPVTGLTVATQPTELSYSHGDALALAGLTVTLTHEDNATETVAYADFAGYGLSVSPQDGQVLYTESNHNQPVTVSCTGLSPATTDVLTVAPTVHLVGNPTVGYTIQVSAQGQGGSTMTWKYQYYDSDIAAWTDLSSDNNDSSLSPDSTLIGRSVRAVVTFAGTYSGDVNSNTVTVLAPQLSVSVPVTMTVTVSGDGSMSVSAGSILNYSVNAVKLTSVTYTWQTSGASDADELFSDYTAVTPTLTLAVGNAHSFGGEGPVSWSDISDNNGLDAIAGDTPGALALNWTFTLGTGNYISLPIAAGDAVQVATISYTVSASD